MTRSRLEPLGVAGIALVVFVAAIGVIGPLLVSAEPFKPTGAPLLPPASPGHPLGTDDLGRDILAGVVHGSRASLLVGFVTALASAAIGTAVGAAAGYWGGRVDDLLMRATEFVQVVPRFFLALVIAALFGPSLPVLVVLLGLTFWPGTARLLRSRIFALREREYIFAARATGVPARRVVIAHLLPNAIGVVVTSAALQVGGAILTEASLAFVGLGDPTVISWGRMLNDAQPFLRLAWWMSVFPGIALVATVLGTNLVADAAYRAWDPRARGG